jgi:hypothetical protein
VKLFYEKRPETGIEDGGNDPLHQNECLVLSA